MGSTLEGGENGELDARGECQESKSLGEGRVGEHLACDM